jgi:hypothetical protein
MEIYMLIDRVASYGRSTLAYLGTARQQDKLLEEEYLFPTFVSASDRGVSYVLTFST